MEEKKSMTTRLKKLSEAMEGRTIRPLGEGSKFVVYICVSCGSPNWAYGKSKTTHCRNCNHLNRLDNVTIVLKTDVPSEAMLAIQMLKMEKRIDFPLADLKPKERTK